MHVAVSHTVFAISRYDVRIMLRQYVQWLHIAHQHHANSSVNGSCRQLLRLNVQRLRVVDDYTDASVWSYEEVVLSVNVPRLHIAADATCANGDDNCSKLLQLNVL